MPSSVARGAGEAGAQRWRGFRRVAVQGIPAGGGAGDSGGWRFRGFRRVAGRPPARCAVEAGGGAGDVEGWTLPGAVGAFIIYFLGKGKFIEKSPILNLSLSGHHRCAMSA
jgi:hypothetical protein